MTTLLHEAAQNGQVAAVHWLLQAGLNPAARNGEQKTSLDLARGEQHHAVVQVLRNAAAAAAAPGGSGASSEASTPTAAAAAAIAARGGTRQQQQQQQQGGRLAGQLVVYPEDEQYKFYPELDKRLNM
jgi:hypothetical protein